MIRLAAFALVLALAVPVGAQSFLVNDTSNAITAYTEQTNPAAVTGSTWVLESTIRAATPPGATDPILPGATWDGTTYTAPAGEASAVTVATRKARLARLILENWTPYLSPALKAADRKRLESQIDALVRTIIINSNVITNTVYDILLAEAQVSGGSFLRYAGDQWINDTNGYYRTTGTPAFFPEGSWRIHTIHQAINGGTATNGGTAGVSLSSAAETTTAAASFNWPIELHKLASP